MALRVYASPCSSPEEPPLFLVSFVHEHNPEPFLIPEEGQPLRALQPEWVTICRIWDNEEPKEAKGLPIAVGYALCRKGDQFRKTQGRKLALARALKSLPYADRALVWAAYWNSGAKA
jgi:hypothetical protein